MKICAFNIDGTNIAVRKFWTDAELSGSNPYALVETTVPAGYTDVSSIKNWDEIGHNGLDEPAIAIEIEALMVAAGGFSFLSDADKEIAIKHGVAVNTDAYSFKGMSDAVALSVKASEALGKDRGKRVKDATGYLSTNLTKGDAFSLIDESAMLVVYFEKHDVQDFVRDGEVGLLDWVNNTVDYAGTGLRGKALSVLNSVTLTQLCDKLVEILTAETYQI